RIQTENEPAFERYIADNDPNFLQAAQKETGELIKLIHQQREIIRQKTLSLERSALSRTAVHARYGKMDVPRWLEFFLLHESHHLYTIFMLTADLRTSLHLQIS
ncbi:MAG TPA: hypothetical protein VEB42_03935, partial [Chitinophagaceae bacterium]|nr:hypothetical protein [Chitinophagaceae bacterium]